MPEKRTILVTSSILFVYFTLFFLWNIDSPTTLNFDEFHYIPSARQFLSFTENQNYEHPPFAKEMIALGVKIVGDIPVGWRFMSTIFGSLTIVGMYLIALALFRNHLSGLFVALLTGVNNVTYVQARIGMIDTIMASLLVCAFAAGLWAFLPRNESSKNPFFQKRLLDLSGVLIGLAVASKWFAVVPFAAFWVFFGFFSFFKWKEIPQHSFGRWDFVRSLLILPCVSYFMTFLPYLWVTPNIGQNPYNLKDIFFNFQWKIWDGQRRVIGSHPYQSSWFQWPLMNRPIWYFFEASSNPQRVNGIVCLGNPLVFWGGLVTMNFAFWDFFRSRSFPGFWIVFTYSVLLFSWPFIPRELAFFYYYYPASLILGLSWAYFLLSLTPEKKLLWVHGIVLLCATILFFYFFPLLSGMNISYEKFLDLMWFRVWI